MVVPLAFGWRHVLFANWPVDPAVIQSRLPDGLSVQTYDGRGWLSVVPFVNVKTRPRGFPRWAGIRLPELNLRTYVTCDGEPGVYFFNLDAEGVLSVVGARLTHHLPYYYSRISVEPDGDRIDFSARRLHPGSRPCHFEATYGPIGDRFEAEPGSLAEFLTERRRLYAKGQDGAIRYTDVSHPRWPLYDAELAVRENELFDANGFEHPDSEPTLYYSPATEVTTTRSKRWSRSG